MSQDQPTDLDPKFFERADSHIHLSNSQTAEASQGKVSASMMFATARFNAYVSWNGFDKAEDMAAARDETIEYFVEQYRLMLAENLDDYIKRFDEYKQTSGGTHPDDQ